MTCTRYFVEPNTDGGHTVIDGFTGESVFVSEVPGRKIAEKSCVQLAVLLNLQHDLQRNPASFYNDLKPSD